MLNLRPIDPTCPIDQQLQSKADSVVLAYPSSAVAQPHLFAKVAVPNLCAP